MKRLTFLLRPLAAIASGIGIAALFPPYSVSKLVWVVMIPLLIALWSLGDRWRKRRAIALGYLAGLSFSLLNVAWLRSVSDVGWLVLAVYLAAFPAMWALFVATLGNPWRKGSGKEGLFHAPLHAFACAVVWAGLEWLRSWVFTGFGWNPIGVAFQEAPIFAQGADLLGATGLSILPVFVQGVLVQVCVRRVSQYHSAVLRRQISLGCATLVMASAYIYGVWRISTAREGESIRLKALLVQLNIPQEAERPLWTATEVHLGYEEETLAALEKLGSKSPDWIIWPETALTGRVMRADDGNWGMWDENVLTIDRIRAEGDYTLMMGLTEMEAEPKGDQLVMKDDAKVWNSLAVLPPDGSLQTFRKHHLVIFGEYIPFVEQLPFLAKIYEQQSGAKYGGAFSQGESFEPLTADIHGEKVGLIPSVCFEDTVPRLLRKFVRNGPQIIINVTNDGWFKESAGAAQHFANARFRAIELRRPMIRCSNTGVSAAITTIGTTLHPDGRKAQELRDANGSHFTRGSMLAEVDIPKNPQTSLYSIIGDWGLIGLSVLMFPLMAFQGRARPEEPESGDDEEEVED